MTRQNCIVIAVLLTLLVSVSCSKKMTVHVDGMPIPNFEYVSNDEDTKMRMSYILARYHKVYEGDEHMIVPEFLEAWDEHVIDPSDTESLILHIKVVNLRKVKYNVWREIEIGKDVKSFKNLYHGKLSRKDFSLSLPLTPGQKVKYRITFVEHGSTNDPVFEIGPIGSLSYSVKEVVDPNASGN